MEKNSQKMQNATYDLKFLLNREYPKKNALEFIGNHYLLDRDERNYLLRTIYSNEKSEGRRSKIVPISKIRGKNLFIDGYNVLITVESICKSENSIVICEDGVLRDINAVFGKYKCKERTKIALNSIISLIKIYQPINTHFFFDSQVSKSGQLSKITEQIMREQEVTGSAETAPNVDYQLINLSNETDGVVASSDSVIMDKVNYILDIPNFILKIKEKNLSLSKLIN